MNKPRIIGGTCEFCGIPAYSCMHYQGQVDKTGQKLPGVAERIISEAIIAEPEKFVKSTPLNSKKTTKKLLIGCVDFSELTGMPMYLYNLGKAMIGLGYEISLVSKIGGEIAEMATAAGFKLFSWDQNYTDDYQALILNEPISAKLLDQFPDVPAYNIIHSARPEDEPIPDCPQIRKYFYSKASDLEYIKDKVPANKIESLPIPIDFERFDKKKRKDHSGYVVLAPCSFDELRKPMLKNLVKRAKENPEIKVIIKGKNYGLKIDRAAIPENVVIDETPAKNIEDFMAEADEVAGILLGTVTLEAWAMGLNASVYDLSGNYEMIKAPRGFNLQHSAKMVAAKLNRILNEKWADIVIPHHDQADLLAQTLKTIPLRNYNVVIVRGTFFAAACNKGAKLAETDKIIFANDDLVLNPRVLWKILDAPEPIVGVSQVYPDGVELCHGIFIDEFGKYELTTDPEKTLYPSGAFFKVDKAVWKELGGLCEEYINGGEDQDLFLSALEAGHKTAVIDDPIVHYCSRSTGRFDYLTENDLVLKKRWPEKRLRKLFKI